MTDRLAFLHIGDYKTGTTWLQRYVFGADPRLHLLGEREGDADARLWADLENLTYATAPDLDRWRSDFASHLAVTDVERVRCISRESLVCGDPYGFSGWESMPERLFRAFGSTRVVLTFREPLSLLSSLYSTYVKNGGTLTMRHLYLDAGCALLRRRLGYHRIAEAYADTFGRDNCLFLNFADLQRNRQAFVARIYDFIGLTAPEIRAGAARPNRSLNASALCLQRGLNRLVRSDLHRSGRGAIAEGLIRVGIDCLAPAKVRRLQSCGRDRFLWPEVRMATGRHFPVENTLYLSGLRAFAEKITLGRPLAIEPQVREAAAAVSAEINRRLAHDFGISFE